MKFVLLEAEAERALHGCAVLHPLLTRVTNECGLYTALVLTWTKLAEAITWEVSSLYKESGGDRRWQAYKRTNLGAG